MGRAISRARSGEPRKQFNSGRLSASRAAVSERRPTNHDDHRSRSGNPVSGDLAATHPRRDAASSDDKKRLRINDRPDKVASRSGRSFVYVNRASSVSTGAVPQRMSCSRGRRIR